MTSTARPLLASFLLAAALGEAFAAPVVGAAAPEFRLQDQTGKWHSLADYRGRWVVLYFYVKDATPSCTAQACDFRDNILGFRELDAAVLGVSVDDVESHRKFSEKHGLPFPLLADSTTQTAAKYGVLRKILRRMEVASRETFIIDPNGRIAKHYPSVDPKSGHSKQVLRDLRTLARN